MRACVQRVSSASVTVEGEICGMIDAGLVVLLGITHDDGDSDIEYLASKTCNLRIFEDNDGKMNLSLLDVGQQMLVISQFTLFGDCRKGRRPSFGEAAPPAKAEALYEQFVGQVRALGVHVETGKFQAMMDVALVNQGPVTMLLDSRRSF